LPKVLKRFVELVRGRDLRRSISLTVVQEIALLLADVDQLTDFVVLLLDREVGVPPTSVLDAVH